MAAHSRILHTFQAPCLRDLARWVDEKPHAPALVGVGQPAVSFQLLATRIAAVARALRAAGVGSGDVVAVAMPDGPDLLTTLLGAMEAGAVAPMDWQHTEAEFRSRLTLLPACLLLTRISSGAHGPAVVGSLGVPVVDLSDSETIPEVSHVRGRVPDKCALVLQTSGTSGEPKLVPLTHKNLRAICTDVQNGLALHAEDRYMSIMPLHHILGFASAVGQLMAGGSVACTGFNAAAFPAWIEELSPTWYSAGPALHRAILEIAKQDPGPFRRSPLRFVRCGSGAGSPSLLNELERVLQVDVINGYGLTEMGCATNTPPGLPRKTGSVGRSIGPEIGIVDTVGNFLSPGSEGEVVLRGDEVMEGYLNSEEANREVFLNGWFRTGDLGRMDHEGDLFITGRIKESINRGGETISPVEIDHALEEHPDILRAASFAVAHPTLGEDIVAALVLRPGARAVASEIRNFLAERLSRSKVPGRIWFVESIPLSASGKPLREALRTQFHASAQSREYSPSPASKNGAERLALLDDRIGTVWMRVLNSDRPEVEDNFFAMGGDSLSATRMFALLGAELQVEEASTDLARFLDSPTFFQLVQVVGNRTRRPEIRFEDVSAVCLQPAGDCSPVFFFPAEGVEPWYLRHLVQAMGDQQPFYALRHKLPDSANFPDIASRFVSLISGIHPTGPLVLVGHCYGGVLAYEVAQRMVAMSRTEVAVALINVNAPGYPKPLASRYWRYLPTALRSVLRGEGGKLVAELAGHFRFLAALRERKQWYREAHAAGDPKPSGPVVQITPGGIVLRTYVPRPFPGRMANVLAAGHAPRSERVLEDPRKGWREFARGPFQESSLSGSHFSILDAENAPALASFIRSALQASSTAVP